MKKNNVNIKEINSHIKEDEKKKRAKPLNFIHNSTLNEEYLIKAFEYFSNCARPYLEELALNLDIDEDTITNWAKTDKNFGAIVKRIKLKQKFVLLRESWSKDHATNALLFQLRVNHGMVDTTGINLGNKDGEAFKMNIDNFDKLSNEELQRLITRES